MTAEIKKLMNVTENTYSTDVLKLIIDQEKGKKTALESVRGDTDSQWQIK